MKAINSITGLPVDKLISESTTGVDVLYVSTQWKNGKHKPNLCHYDNLRHLVWKQ